uniref:Protein GrpE n=1 Tax=Candidatus Kentrum sp. FW TaxID=2126338 RepID=A0A450TGN6_9GAMM|nr:MAG: molecular chaperone GrpE [Candidatus Kentron sp. FW]
MASDQPIAQEHEDRKPDDLSSQGKSSAAEPSVEKSVTDEPIGDKENTPDASAPEQKIDDSTEPPEKTSSTDDAQSGGSSLDDLANRLMAAEQQVEEHRNAMLRLQAEMENLRKRSAREVENAHKYGLDRFVSELLPVKDSLELGIAATGDDKVDVTAIREGMELTLKMFATAMGKSGVEEVFPAPGERFDPERHQAMSMQEDKEKESGTISMVIQKGYLLNNRLVRPAMVIVVK